MTAPAPCEGCGLLVPGGTAGCQAIMDEMLARDFSDVAYFRVHRMLVDVYCLQHPDRYCVTARSLAAHLSGLCMLLEHGGNRAIGSERLRAWLNGSPRLTKPAIPSFRGAMTIADIRGAPDPVTHGRLVDRWARSTWDAYAPLHAVARRWLSQALARSKRPAR